MEEEPEEKKRVIIIDLENFYHSIKNRSKKKLDFYNFYFNFIRCIAKEKPANVYIYFSKEGSRTPFWLAELDALEQGLSAVYSINCIMRAIPLKKRNRKILGSKVDHEIIGDLTEMTANPEMREKISELILVSSDFDFLSPLERAYKYHPDITMIADWTPSLTKRSEDSIRVIYLEEIFQRNPKLFKQFDFKRFHDTKE